MAKNSAQNQALLKELEDWLQKQGLSVETERTFSQFMETKRRFRADYLILDSRIANYKGIILEVNGGHWTFGRHNRGKGYENDLIKSNMAQVNAYIYLQYTYGQLKERLYIADITKIIEA
jgi:hypothetical protein